MDSLHYPVVMPDPESSNRVQDRGRHGEGDIDFQKNNFAALSVGNGLVETQCIASLLPPCCLPKIIILKAISLISGFRSCKKSLTNFPFSIFPDDIDRLIQGIGFSNKKQLAHI